MITFSASREPPGLQQMETPAPAQTAEAPSQPVTIELDQAEVDGYYNMAALGIEA